MSQATGSVPPLPVPPNSCRPLCGSLAVAASRRQILAADKFQVRVNAPLRPQVERRGDGRDTAGRLARLLHQQVSDGASIERSMALEDEQAAKPHRRAVPCGAPGAGPLMPNARVLSLHSMFVSRLMNPKLIPRARGCSGPGGQGRAAASHSWPPRNAPL